MPLRDLFVRIKGDKTSLDSTLKGAEGSINKFSSIVKKLGGVIAAAFGVQAIINFTKESMKMAASFEGIKKGFEQIATPGLLKELQKATHGTVSDMQLMSRAVQASNFQIPLKDLAKLLEFASARAVQTGQSVDYLVDSIVLGIGRKSPLILDNLGISAVRLRQLLKGPGVEMASVGDIAKAVGSIATEELKKMGGMAETTGTKFQSLAASVDNLKVSWGNFANNSKAVKGIVQWLSDELAIFADKNLTLWEKMLGSPNEYKKYLAGIEEVRQKFGFGNDLKDAKSFTGAWSGKGGSSADQATTIKSLTAQLEKEKTALDLIDIADQKAIKNQIITIQLLEKRIKKLQELQSTEINRVGKLNPLIENKKRFGASSSGLERPNTLAGAPAAGDQSLANDMGAQADIDAKLAAAELKLEEYMTKVEDVLQSGKDMAIDLGGEFIGALGEAIGGGNMKDIGKSLLISFANFMSTFGKMLITLGIGMKAFQESLKNLFTNPLVPIVAGVALMATAGIIRGAAQKAANGVSGGGSSGGGYSSQASSDSGKIELKGVLRGSDIYLSGVRYGRSLSTGT